MKRRVLPRSLLALFATSLAALALAACTDDEPTVTAGSGGGATNTGGSKSSAGAAGNTIQGGSSAGGGGSNAGAGAGGSSAGAAGTAGSAGSAGATPSPFAAIPIATTLTATGLTAPVEVVRDEHGIPHIYGDTLPDVSYAQGYTMAADRFIEMDFARHSADGTLSKLFGSALSSVIDTDIQMRVHHLRKTAQNGLAAFNTSTDPEDQMISKVLTEFTAGVNAWITETRAGKHSFPKELTGLYGDAIDDWLPEDSILLGELQAFSLAFDGDSDLGRTTLNAKSKATFDMATDSALLLRKGAAHDLSLFAPVDPTHTIDGFTGQNGDTSTASLPTNDGNFLALLDADRKSVQTMGLDKFHQESKGSNNWIISGKNTTSGNVLVANDTHLGLINPSTFYLVHLSVRNSSPVYDVMGVEFPGIPGVILGNNEHMGWGSTVNNIDVTDIYSETVVGCGDGSSDVCVQFNGAPVKLVPRTENFDIGLDGALDHTLTVTMYDVPQHGPIVPRINPDHTLEALGTTELSLKYTGYTSAPLLKAVYGLNIATTMADGVKALDASFKYGGQNWVIGDDQGHIGWTQTIRVPLRAPGSPPYLVLPGDGSAEWGADMDPKFIPHSYDPDKGYLVTANADPVGTTDDDDPFNGPDTGNGSPLYLGSDYDPGTRAGRITKRIQAGTASGGKLQLDDMISIQSDAVSEWHAIFAPVYVDAAKALSEEIATPGTHAELATIATGLTAAQKTLLPKVRDIATAWTSYDTPSGDPADNPTAQQTADSQAALLIGVWTPYFAQAALGDEVNALGVGLSSQAEKLTLARMIQNPSSLTTGVSTVTNDAVLYDDLTTKDVVESQQFIAASSLVTALAFLETSLGEDITTWHWGQVHTLTLDFLAGGIPLNVPTGNMGDFPKVPGSQVAGWPRHGASGTVDVGDPGLSLTDFTYVHGPAIRFSCEVDTKTGPHAKNALPGGEIFDEASPHYRDQAEIWRKNQVFDLAFKDADVLASAQTEVTTNQGGRVVFNPKLRPRITTHPRGIGRT